MTDSAPGGTDGPDLEAVVRMLRESASQHARADVLRRHGLDSQDGVKRLVEHVNVQVGMAPAAAQSAAEAVAQGAERLGLDAAAAEATYLAARAAAYAGHLDDAGRLVEAARKRYEAVGDERGAVRTELGRMHVLMDLGRPAEALDVGAGILESLAGADDSEAQALRAVAEQNRGLALYFTGRYADALTSIDRAQAAFGALGRSDDLARNRVNRGLALLGLGRGTEALRAFESASDLFEEFGQQDLHARALTNVGNAHLSLGNYNQSLRAFNEAREGFRRSAGDGDADEHPMVLLDAANAHLALNMFPEALDDYRRAEQAFHEQGAMHERGRSLWGMGAALVGQGRHEEAERALTEAAGIFQSGGNDAVLASVLLEHSALQQAQGLTPDAVATARRALDLAEAGDLFVQRAYGCLRMADLLHPAPDAERYVHEAMTLGETVDLPHIRFRCNERLGRLALERGRHQEAESLLNQAIDDIEAARGTLAAESLRSSFLRDKVRAYESLVGLYLARGDADSLERAFVIAERAKSRSLVDMIMGVIDAQLDEDVDPATAQRLQGLRSDLNAVYNEWLGSEGGQRAVALSDLQARAVDLEREIRRIQLHATPRVEPDGIDGTLDLQRVRPALPDGAVLLAYHVVAGDLVAFVVTRDRIGSVQGLGPLADVVADIRRLSDQWVRFRAGRAFVDQHIEVLEQTTGRLLGRLHDRLIAPVRAEIEAAARRDEGPVPMIVVPHGALHQVPFHALYDGRDHLVDQFEISYAPSATVHALCTRRAEASFGRSLVMAVADAAIPAASREARAVAEQLTGADVLLDDRATIRAFRDLGPGCDVIHLACHGLFRADNPMFSALRLSDGWLTAADVLAASLQGTQITLSACESGRSQVIGGDEIMGLTRAFLGAGATSVLVSQWIVHDEATADLMSTYYGNLNQGQGPATALRAAQLAARKLNHHPYYWAPFSLIGKR